LITRFKMMFSIRPRTAITEPRPVWELVSKGYLLKNSPQEKLIAAVLEIAREGTVLSPNIATKVIENLAEVSEGGHPRRTSDLTVREIEILEMLYQGLRNAASDST